ncbi:DUF2057 domain-containing protein [Pseudoalteromonas rubra]|uniref:DUF2057 domain-containing protein n=1 Tax=Pseudoalteromonas rubra TaxID=43658 RepID=A0A5S3WHU3_9GAMM|nr:DUF2057 domain-containing protein [Pseudoalteromonas rubra]TMP26771.1 DUF2057 domain-containing protein [Pseudoalteromonas rubra]TMP30744.1 DUF2057 domain-containing protein [Pseudoalteromonas rubra]
MKKIRIFCFLCVSLFCGRVMAAQVHFPEELLPLQVGQQEIEHSFFNKVRDLTLSTGMHQIRVKYTDLYEIDYDDHEVIESKPFWITIEASAQGDYHVQFDRADTLKAAKQFAKQPQLWLKAPDGTRTPVKTLTEQLRIRSVPQATERLKTPVTKPDHADSLPVEPPVAPQASKPALSDALPAAPQAGKPDAAAMLEFWWQQASPAQRAAFLEKVQPR